MADIKLQDAIVEVKDLPARPKALGEEGMENVFGGFYGGLNSRSRRRPPRRRPGGQRPGGGRPQFGRRPPQRRVPVYAWRRVQVGWRLV